MTIATVTLLLLPTAAGVVTTAVGTVGAVAGCDVGATVGKTTGGTGSCSDCCGYGSYGQPSLSLSLTSASFVGTNSGRTMPVRRSSSCAEGHGRYRGIR